MRINHPAAAAAFQAVARVFGEPIRITPLVSSEYAEGIPDPDRPETDTRAVIAMTPRTEEIDGARAGSKIGSTTRLSLREASAWFPPAVYAAIGYALRPGDRVVLLDRPDEPPYRVARDPVASDRGDVTVYLTTDGDQ